MNVHGPDGRILARCALWWRHVPRYKGQSVGYIGEYSACNGESAAQLLDMACGRLTEAGRTLAVGPADGSTWMSYRFVIDAGNEPPFFLEPQNPPEWPAQFRSTGFKPLAYYRSSIQDDLSIRDGRVAACDARLKRTGVRIRPLDVQRFDADLRRIHALSLEAFSSSLLFSSIPVEVFVERYRGLMRIIEPELVTIAEHGDQLVGYLFALPDMLEITREKHSRTIILKTIAVLPGRRYSGLGHVLAMHAAARARKLGYTRVIHALMREGNGSANWSAKLGRPIRRYALFAKTLNASH